jgi:hypothetical protein
MKSNNNNHTINSTATEADHWLLPELSSADLRLLSESLGRLTDSPSALDAQEWEDLIGESLEDARVLLSRLHATSKLRIPRRGRPLSHAQIDQATELYFIYISPAMTMDDPYTNAFIDFTKLLLYCLY